MGEQGQHGRARWARTDWRAERNGSAAARQRGREDGGGGAWTREAGTKRHVRLVLCGSAPTYVTVMVVVPLDSAQVGLTAVTTAAGCSCGAQREGRRAERVIERVLCDHNRGSKNAQTQRQLLVGV